MKRILLLVLLSIIFQRLIIAQDLQIKDAIKRYQIGEKQLNNGNYELALSTFNQLIEQAEQKHYIDLMPTLYYYRAKCNVLLKNNNDVCVDLKDALEYNVFESVELAQTNCPELLNVEFESEYYYNLGSKLYFQEQFEKAIPYLNKAIILNPKNVQALSVRAESHKMTNNFDKAISDYSRVIELNPDDTDNYWFRAELLLQFNRLESALDDLNQSLNLDPTNIFALRLRGKTNYALKNYDKALDDFDQVIEEWPTYENYLDRAKIYIAIGKNKMACEDLNKIPGDKINKEIEGLLKKCG